MDTLLNLKNTCDDFEVEFDVIPAVDIPQSMNRQQIEIFRNLQSVEMQINQCQKRIDEINVGIDRLINHADGIDYMVAVGSGLLAGFVDSFWVGEFSLERGKSWSNEQVNNFVTNIAKKNGYKGDDLEGAIKHLEKKYGVPSDSVTSKFGGGLQHHLRDFAHHPTPVGLAFSMLTQFTGKAYGTDEIGNFQIVDVENKAFIGKDVPQKLLFGTVFWFFHMVSDMAGSSSSPGGGTGIPGPIVSLLKEVSALPFFKNTVNVNGEEVKEFSLWISKLFNGTLLAEHEENGNIIKDTVIRFDLRAEIGLGYELGRQALPVILNECIVRGFYFIRRLVKEIKEKHVSHVRDLKAIDWKKTLPFKNRTIVRMLTISSGTFTAVDLADAAIRSAAKSGGFTPAFLGNFVLRINFIGVGRFAVAVGTDVKMGIDRSKLRNERMEIYNQMLQLSNAKVYYKQADMWIAAESAGETIEEAYNKMEDTMQYFTESIQEIKNNMQKISDYLPGVENKNPGLLTDISDALKWG